MGQAVQLIDALHVKQLRPAAGMDTGMGTSTAPRGLLWLGSHAARAGLLLQ